MDHRKPYTLLCHLLLILLSTATVMVSDLFIRSQEIPGVNPHAYDLIGTVGIVGGSTLYLLDWLGIRPTEKQEADSCE
jgi:hypothetical protein